MTAKIVRSMEDVREFYYYKDSPPPIPKELPCIMVEEDEDYGIAGNCRTYKFHYVRAALDLNSQEAYMRGYLDGLK